MSKKYYLFLIILVVISIFSASAICNLSQPLSSKEDDNNQKILDSSESEPSQDGQKGPSSSEKSGSTSETSSNGKDKSTQASSGSQNTPPVIKRLIASMPDGSDPGDSSIDKWVMLQGIVLLVSCEVYDEQNDNITFNWSTDGGSFDDPSSKNPTFTATDAIGDYFLKLDISDGKGGTDSLIQDFEVIDSAAQQNVPKSGTAPKVSAIDISDSPVYIDRKYEITVTASDDENDIDYYDFDNVDRAGTLLNQRGNVTDWITPIDPGNYTIAVTVYDLGGNETTMARSFDVISEFEIIENDIEILDIIIDVTPLYVNTKYSLRAEIIDRNNEVTRFVFKTNYGKLSGQSAKTISWTTPDKPGAYPIILQLFGDKDPQLILAEKNFVFDVVTKK